MDDLLKVSSHTKMEKIRWPPLEAKKDDNSN